MGRRVFLAVPATISALTAAGLISPADATGLQDRYCLQGPQSDYPGNCQFNSYFQCMAAASSKGDQCRENPKCYRRIELTSKRGKVGEFRCPTCDERLELLDGSTDVAFRLTVQPSKILRTNRDRG